MAEVLKTIAAVALSACIGWKLPVRGGLVVVLALCAALQVAAGFADAPNGEILVETLPFWWSALEVRRRRALVRELGERARQLEVEQEGYVRLAVERERARIARDLHDVVSHHLAVMVIQAGAGRLGERWDPAVAGGRFATIRRSGMEALAETERLVTVLQGQEEPPGLAPLLARARADGARVRAEGVDRPLAPGTERVARRVLQEALTNAMKHAPGAAVDVRVVRTDRALTVEVESEEAAEPSPLARSGSGVGLQGLRERLAEHGGTFAAGTMPGGGFRVAATLPIGAPPGGRSSS